MSSVDKSHLLPLIEAVAEKNLFTALLIEGRFRQVRTRTVARQIKPYRPLTEAAGEQSVNTFSMTTGTLAGFLSPGYAQGLQVAGFHLHFSTADRQAGGHMPDFVADHVTVNIAAIQRLRLDLPLSSAFLRADLSDVDVRRAVEQVEA